MSSQRSTAETPVSAPTPDAGRIDLVDPDSRFDVERRLLCARIEELERELERERRRREQVVDHYERLLSERSRETEPDGNGNGGWFSWLR